MATAPDLLKLPAPPQEYDPRSFSETMRVVQLWMESIIRQTSDFYEGRYEAKQILPQDLILRGVSDPTLTVFLGNTYTYNFADAAANEVYFSIEIPHSWSGESPIYPYIRWSPTDTGTGVVRWELEYTKAKLGTVFPATTTITGETAGSGAASDHIKTELGGATGIDLDGDDISTIISCRLIRNGAHANDTYTAAAALHSIGFVYLADSLGSEQAFVKKP